MNCVSKYCESGDWICFWMFLLCRVMSCLSRHFVHVCIRMSMSFKTILLLSGKIHWGYYRSNREKPLCSGGKGGEKSYQINLLLRYHFNVMEGSMDEKYIPSHVREAPVSSWLDRLSRFCEIFDIYSSQ